MNRRRFLTYSAAGAASTAWAYGTTSVLFGGGSGRRLLNCSYDATRELYRHVNRLFAERTAAVRVTPSHGGSGSQARAVIDGLPADVVTLAMWPDTNAIAEKGLIRPDWVDRFPNRSCPYTSTIVFVVRKGNPHGVRDWTDLRDRAGIRVVAANPKTSGAAKLGMIACWGSVTAGAKTEADYRSRAVEAERLVSAVYGPGKMPSLETSSRAASVTFARKRIGDVQLTWENEAWLEVRETRGEVEVVYPSRSLLAEPHVAVVDGNADRNGTAELASSYLEFLYSPAAQAVIADNYFRPTTESGSAAFHARLAADGGHAADAAGRLDRFPVTDAVRFVPGVADGWAAAQRLFFADGGLFDRAFAAAG
jgi:sulfate/thiosulfate-binding protein